MRAGDYFRPNNLHDALEIRKSRTVRVAAGCTDLFPATTAQELPGNILDVTDIAELRGIEKTDDGIRMGATTRWTDIIRAKLPPCFDGLKAAAREVGSPPIQNAGTIAGNLCNASPAADGVPCLLTLDAQIECRSLDQTRILPLGEFIIGPRKTALRQDEIVTAILVPGHALQGTGHFSKLGARRYLIISITMVAVRMVHENDVIADLAIAVGACSAVAKRLEELEQHLIGRKTSHLPENLFDLVSSALAPISDVRADASYRHTAAAELVHRMLVA